MDPRLNQLLVPSELDRRIAAARAPRPRRRHARFLPQRPPGRTVNPSLGAQYSVARRL